MAKLKLETAFINLPFGKFHQIVQSERFGITAKGINKREFLLYPSPPPPPPLPDHHHHHHHENYLSG